MEQTPYKFRDITTYCDTEWLANDTKKYRSVFDIQELTYVYCEVSFFNKFFDQKEWSIRMDLICLDEKNNQICSINCDRPIGINEHIAYIREGWGVKTTAKYWQPGVYRWEAYVDGELIATKNFYVENIGKVKSGFNPYFKINTVKLFEGNSSKTKEKNHKYYSVFNPLNTRYIFTEITAENLTRRHTDLPLELIFNYRTNSGFLKGRITQLFFVKSDENSFVRAAGIGSNIIGSWARGKYYVEIIFMSEMMAHVPFEIGDDFVEATEDDFRPFTPFLLPAADLSVEQITELDPNSTDLLPQKGVDEVMFELDSLIGLTPIKQKIREYSDYLRFVKLRKERGFIESDRINLHAVFKGNPGTGKTTVARLLGQIYKELGLLKKGHVHEVDRADLVAEYIGQTAPKTKEAIKKAKDGILFIDEAYALARKDDDNKDFGKEVIEILLKELSDADDIAIVVAGYPSEMEIFLESNPGLKSRFTIQYDFPDYTPQELVEIAGFASKKRGINLSENASESLKKFLTDRYRERDKFFGNARLVNSMLDEAKINLGLRVMKTEHPEELDSAALSTLEKADFDKIFAEKTRVLPEIPIDEELLKESLNKLKGMIGLEQVKEEIEELVKLVRFYKSMGRDVRKTFSLHSVFSGNPGTGKTTVARILAQIYKALGILERGHLVECDRQSLVGGYVGQTAIKTSELINKSMGGVLFVDEAYSLTEGGGGDFGREAVETLLKRMEDRRGEFIVIAAGYTQNMERFMESNPGLKSRFDRVFNFTDFSADDLYTIAINQLTDHQITPEPKAADHIMRYIDFLYRTRDKYFGNGRSVRRVVEEAIRNQHLRLAELPEGERDEKMIHTLTYEDVQEFNTEVKPNIASGGIGFRV